MLDALSLQEAAVCAALIISSGVAQALLTLTRREGESARQRVVTDLTAHTDIAPRTCNDTTDTEAH